MPNLLELCIKGDMKEVIKDMIQPSFAYGTTERFPYEFDFENGWRNRNGMATVCLSKYMLTMLEFDEFTDEVNRLIYATNEMYSQVDLLKYMKDELKHEIEFELKDYAFYTYNDTTDLDRDFIYSTFETCGSRLREHYVLIQVHYGRDANGVVGDMVCFKIKDIDYFLLGMFVQVYSKDNEYESHQLEWNEELNRFEVDGEEVEVYSHADGF